jgi:hypothetical protein
MNRLFLFLLLLVGVLGNITTALAEAQKYLFDEEKHIEGFISANEMNRIKIQGERISEVVGLDGDFVLESDEVNGQIFIKVAGNATEATRAEFSIVTESGKTQDFRLRVRANINGQILLIEHSQQNAEVALSQLTGAKNIKHEEIIFLIRRAYDLPTTLQKNKSYKTNNMEIALAGQITSGKYMVQIWEIKNISSKPLELREKQFVVSSEKVMGVAIQNRILLSGEVSKIFKVIQHA